METVFHLTKEGLEKLKKEFSQLQALKREKTQDEAPQALHSEELDTEFVAFKEDLEFLDSRLSELEYVLKYAEVIKAPKKEARTKVGLGAKVKLAVNNQEDEFFIVGTLEADPNLGKISNESPVGKALFGHKAGDEVEVNFTNKTVYKIKKVSY